MVRENILVQTLLVFDYILSWVDVEAPESAIRSQIYAFKVPIV